MLTALKPVTQKRIAFSFLCGFLLTLVVHAYGFMNHFNIHDQVRNVFAIPATITLGRWLLGPVLEIGSRLSMPWFNGLMLAAALGLTTAVLTETFGWKKRLPTLLAALTLATFPTLTESILYIHVVDAYGYAILLAALAVFVTDRYLLGFLPGAVLLSLSLGIYQAYLPLAIGLFSIRGLMHLLAGTHSDRQVFGRAVRYGLATALALGIYLLVNRAVLASAGTQLDDYMGVSAMGTIQWKNLGHMLKTAYLSFFTHFIHSAQANADAPLQWLNGAVLGFDLLAIVVLLFRQRRTPLQYILIAGIAAMLPLLLNTIYLFNSTYVHTLMVFSVACAYWLAIALGQALAAEPFPFPWERIRRAVAALLAAALLLIGFTNAVYANQVYYILNLDYEATSQFASRVLYRLESRDDFTLDTPVLFVGRASNNPYGSITFYKQAMPRFANANPFAVMQSDSHVRGFMRSYLGIELAAPDAATADRLMDGDAVRAMPAYPAQGCIENIEGVLVVKLSPI